jgi:hypothetical protein
LYIDMHLYSNDHTHETLKQIEGRLKKKTATKKPRLASMELKESSQQPS